MKHIIIKYGLWGGLISIALGLINWFTVAQVYGPKISQVIGYLTIILALLCVPLGIKYHRDQINGGNLPFAMGFKIGLGITSLFSALTFLYCFIFFTVAGDDFRAWNERFLTPAELQTWQQEMAEAPAFVVTPWFQSLILVVTVFIIGMVINLISVMILRRD